MPRRERRGRGAVEAHGEEEQMSALRKLNHEESDAIATRLDELEALVPAGTVVELPTRPDDGIDPNQTSAWVWGWVH
jgi:hypothetical protein